MNGLRERFQRFMMGRYGHDSLNQAMAVAALVLMILGMFGLRLFSWLAMALLVAVYFRMFSRNIPARSQENAKYYYLRTQVQKRMAQYQTRWAQRKFYRYYRCPNCHQQLRVPRGRGKIEITCPKCHTEFVKKS